MARGAKAGAAPVAKQPAAATEDEHELVAEDFELAQDGGASFLAQMSLPYVYFVIPDMKILCKRRHLTSPSPPLMPCRDVKTYFNPKTARLRAFKDRQRKLKQLETGEADFETQPRPLSRDWIDAACKYPFRMLINSRFQERNEERLPIKSAHAVKALPNIAPSAPDRDAPAKRRAINSDDEESDAGAADELLDDESEEDADSDDEPEREPERLIHPFACNFLTRPAALDPVQQALADKQQCGCVAVFPRIECVSG